MRRPSRKKTLTGNVTAHVTHAEEERIVQRAIADGLSKSEWCRGVLLKALDTPPDTRLLLSELMALRAVMLTLQSNGLLGKSMTEQSISELVKQAEARKFAMAENRIQAFRSQASEPKEPAA